MTLPPNSDPALAAIPSPAMAVDLDEIRDASLVILPTTSDGNTSVYTEWSIDLVRELRGGGIQVAWATNARHRTYSHQFSAEVETAVQVALLVLEPLTTETIKTVIEYLKTRIMTGSRSPQPITFRYVTETGFDPSTGTITDMSEVTIGADAVPDVAALVREVNAGAVARWKALGLRVKD